jgi:hypothetical protein
MDSSWQLPLPLEDAESVNIVVCYHSAQWIPLTCFSYSEALSLSRKASLKGKELLLFPAGLNLENQNILLSGFSCCQT